MPLPTHQPVWLSTQTKRSTLTLSSFPSPAHGHGSALKQVKILPTTVIGRHKQDRHFPWPRPSQSPSLIWKTRASIKLSSHGQKLEFFTMIFFFGTKVEALLYFPSPFRSNNNRNRKEREGSNRQETGNRSGSRDRKLQIPLPFTEQSFFLTFLSQGLSPSRLAFRSTKKWKKLGSGEGILFGGEPPVACKSTRSY